ncbi:MAG: serine/threonine-protein kinase [Planctomycetota bacterium]
MNAGNPCPECGIDLPEDAPGGLCPECLIRGGIIDDAAGDLDPTTPSGKTFVPPTPAELAPLFPHLEVIKLLGHGGMGAVYKARQVKLDRWVALKIIHPETARDPSFAERFTREAQTLARLSHSGIVGVHDFGEITDGIASDSGPLYYFLMEYVDGVNLRQLIGEQSFLAEQTLSIVPQICEALQYAHDNGVVHRDIKPENILVDRNGVVKIADFGLARLVESSRNEYTLTGTHQVMGTPRYMSPEQMAGSRSVDHRADIYSLGVVFYELLTGEVPMGQFEPPSRRAETDVRLDEVVMRALAREPERRFQTVSEMKVRVDECASQADQVHDLVAGPPEPPSGMSSIVEREVAAAWRWVAGETDPWTKKQELPALLMFAIAVAGCLVVMLPWMEYQIDEPLSSQQERAALSANEGRTVDPLPDYPIIESIDGTSYPGAVVGSIAFAAMGLLILATPRELRRSVSWSLMLTLIAGIAIAGIFAIQIDINTQRFTVQVFSNGQWVDQTGTMVTDTSYKIGFYAALACAIAELVFGATGIRHAITSRSKASVEAKADAPIATAGAPIAKRRFSRKAIIGAIWASLFFFFLPLILAPTFVVSSSSAGSGGSSVVPAVPSMFIALIFSLPALTAPFGATILGFVAIGDIRYSNGRVVGLGLAFLDAILFPTLLVGSVLLGAAVLASQDWTQEWRFIMVLMTSLAFFVLTVVTWILLWRSVSRPPQVV